MMHIEQTLMNLGFTKDENNSWLREVFKENIKLKEIHIDTYSENPFSSSEFFMLLLRASEENIVVSNDGNRLIFKKNNKYDDYIMNILFSKITSCFSKISTNYFEFILNIQNIYYRITVLN